MKKNMNINRLLSTTVLLLTILASCNKAENPTIEDPHALDANLVLSPNLFESGMGDRSTQTANVFDIKGVSRSGDFLYISLKGGSVAEDFKVIWDGVVRLSYPAKLQLLLTYDGDEASFDPEAELSIKVNISKIIAPYFSDPTQFTVHVINGSKVAETVLNPNGTSSNK